MSGNHQKILPFYLVMDVSASMTGAKMGAVNQVIPKIVDALAKDPILSDKVRFALIDFSDDARVQLPLCDLLDPHVVLPGLEARGMTSYAAALELLRSEIADNVAQLKADGFVVHRPAVFFISDGVPDHAEDWDPAFRALTEYDPVTGDGFRMHPNIIPCGIDQADPAIMRRLIHPATGRRAMKMYLMDPGFDPAVAITTITEILVASVIQSATDPQSGGSGLTLPADDDLPRGITAHAADDDFDLV